MTEESPRRPVFIFLDAGVPDIGRELETWSQKLHYPGIFSIPFPESFRHTSTPDYRVTLFMQEEILSEEGRIRSFLFSSLWPILVFFTSDSKFVEDAKDEFKSHAELQGGIMLYPHPDLISFSVPDCCQIFMKVICINNKDSCEKRPALVEKMFNALKQYLDQR